MNFKTISFWVIIAIIAFFTRYYKLDVFPPELTIDEVSIGYNAYSILKTGKDEWGNFMPTSFRSVGDYKAPTLIYLTVPFVKIFGLTEMATRLPVALFSTINIFLFWILVQKYIFNRKNTVLPYLATIIFSLSPWLIVFSRSGFEAVVAMTFLLANIIMIFNFLAKNSQLNFFFVIFFAYLSAITYHSNKIVVPIINLYFVVSNFRLLVASIGSWHKTQNNAFRLMALVVIAMTCFFLKNYIFGLGSSRGSMTLLSKDFDYTNGLIPVYLSHPLSWLTSFFGLVSLWYKRLLEYFSANFYLSSGLGLATLGHPGQGVLYAIEYPFLVTGIFLLFFNKKIINAFFTSSYVPEFISIWILVSLLPASVTNNSQHALRTLNALPAFAVLISIGITFTFNLLKHKMLRTVFITGILSASIFGILRFVDYYALHYPVELSETRSYGWRQMAIYARDHHQEYDNVYIDSRFGSAGPYTYGVPYLYFLFYSKYDPATYIAHPQRQVAGQFFQNFENYHFVNVYWPDMDHTKNNLYIASPWSFPSELLNSKNQKYYVPFLNQSSGLYAISER